MQSNPIYATTAARLAACFVDVLIMLPVGLILFEMVLSFVVSGGAATDDRLSQVQALLEHAQAKNITILLMAAVSAFYHAVLESGPRQASIGKLALGLHVVDLSGSRISFGRAFVRAFFRLFPPFAFFQPFSQKRQAAHDMIAGCLVVQASVSPQSNDSFPVESRGDNSRKRFLILPAILPIVLLILALGIYGILHKTARYRTLCFGKETPFGITFNASNGQFWYGGLYKIQYNDTELRIYHSIQSRSPDTIFQGMQAVQIYKDCGAFADLPQRQATHIEEYRKARAAEVAERRRRAAAISYEEGQFNSAPGQTGTVAFRGEFRSVPQVQIRDWSSSLSAASDVTAVLSVTVSNFTWKNTALVGTSQETSGVYGTVRRSYGGLMLYRASCGL